MTRVIDADAFIKMMEEKCDHEAELDEIILSVCRGGIKRMPTVDRWIPCSEELPEDESVPYWTTHEDGSIVMHWYSKECGFTFNWEVDDLEKRKKQGRVIAWMPILQPEPYIREVLNESKAR